MNIAIDFAVLVAVVSGVVQGIKTAVGEKFNRFMPLVADALGVIAALYFLGKNPSSVIIGLIVGLSASGLYSQVKTAAGK